MTGPQPPATVENVPHGRTARRLEWAHLPPAVRGLVERHLGSPVADAADRAVLPEARLTCPLVNPSINLVEQMTDCRLEGIVLKDRTSKYRDGTRAGWSKVKDRSWYEREAWRFYRR